MLARITPLLVLAVAMPAWSQVEPSATGGAATQGDDTQMMTPPPVSGMAYANMPGSEARSNYLATTLTVSPTYIGNVLPNATAAPAGEFTYSIFPSLTLDRSTPRQQETLTYSPSFTFYEPTSVLDAVDQSATLAFQSRFSPTVSLSLQDNFSRTSNVFDQSYLFSNAVTGSTQTPTATVIAPFAEQLTNTANGVVSYQFGRNAMIGGGASFSTFDLPNPTEAAGLYSSNNSGGEVFYTRRLFRTQYLGLAYQYARTVAYPVNAQSETQTHALLPFYTLYFNRAFSVSISAGLQHVDVAESQLPTSNSWSPSVDASMGWQSSRGNIAASYARTATAGQGLVGAYHSSSISASGGWKLARTWTGGLSASYSSINNVTAVGAASYPGGNTISGQCSLGHSIGERFTATLGYDRIHENYSGIAVISADPDSNRESVTVTYQFRKPLGR